MAEIEKIETRTAHLWLDEADFLRAVFKNGAVEELDDAKDNVDVAARLIGDRKVPVLIDMSTMKSISRDARNYYASEKPASYSIAQALITNSTVSNMIGNFFLRLNQPSHKVRLFTSEDEALAWLREQAGLA